MRSKDEGYSSFPSDDFSKKRVAAQGSSRIAGSVLGRHLPPSRADRALQIALLDPQAWEALSSNDHHILCDLPAPHGAAFTWLDAQNHEHGPQPWAALSIALQGSAQEAFVRKLIHSVPETIENDANELIGILKELRRKVLQERKAELLTRAASDPAAYEEYKGLLALEASLK